MTERSARPRPGLSSSPNDRLGQARETSGAFPQPDFREPLADARIRPLLERYVAASGARLDQIDEGILELHIPTEDRPAFRRRQTVRIAFTLDALERDPEAEIAVVGSAFVEQLVTAIRRRGSRVTYGSLAPEDELSREAVALTIPVTNGRPLAPRVTVARHAVVRLLARVVVRAGGAVEEHLLESRHFDAAMGIVVPDAVAARCTVTLPSTDHGASRENGSPRLAATRTTAELVTLALGDLRAAFEPKVRRLREDAQHALDLELQRIDGYYQSLLADGGRGADAPDLATRNAYEAEHRRRRTEEERRHQVRVIVHPIQLSEWQLVVQRAEWDIEPASQGRGGDTLVATRWLNGGSTWELACPHCGTRNPGAVSLCKEGHLACDACALSCAVCEEVFCREHGIACRVDDEPACTEHARTCPSCRQPYCTGHEAVCTEGDHPVCTECAAPCAICAGVVCDAHAKLTAESAPRGERRLCGACRVLCTGGTSESVGRDEVVRCSDCENFVCENHRSTCAVDQRVHCSKHVRRTDVSRRLVCTVHRAECSFEPGTILASDEVWSCGTCGRRACARHSQVCVEDGQRYCDEHVLVLKGEPGKYVCKTHAARCHVDMAAHRLGATSACPVCGRTTCKDHLRSCASCGRRVCVRDMTGSDDKCATCDRLTTTDDPPDNVIAAATALFGERSLPRHWKTARDATHVIVEVDLGWTRHLVFTVRHDATVVSGGRTHSILGSAPLRAAHGTD